MRAAIIQTGRLLLVFSKGRDGGLANMPDDETEKVVTPVHIEIDTF